MKANNLHNPVLEIINNYVELMYDTHFLKTRDSYGSSTEKETTKAIDDKSSKINEMMTSISSINSFEESLCSSLAINDKGYIFFKDSESSAIKDILQSIDSSQSLNLKEEDLKGFIKDVIDNSMTPTTKEFLKRGGDFAEKVVVGMAKIISCAVTTLFAKIGAKIGVVESSVADKLSTNLHETWGKFCSDCNGEIVKQQKLSKKEASVKNLSDRIKKTSISHAAVVEAKKKINDSKLEL